MTSEGPMCFCHRTMNCCCRGSGYPPSSADTTPSDGVSPQSPTVDATYFGGAGESRLLSGRDKNMYNVKTLQTTNYDSTLDLNVGGTPLRSPLSADCCSCGGGGGRRTAANLQFWPSKHGSLEGAYRRQYSADADRNMSSGCLVDCDPDVVEYARRSRQARDDAPAGRIAAAPAANGSRPVASSLRRSVSQPRQQAPPTVHEASDAFTLRLFDATSEGDDLSLPESSSPPPRQFMTIARGRNLTTVDQFRRKDVGGIRSSRLRSVDVDDDDDDDRDRVERDRHQHRDNGSNSGTPAVARPSEPNKTGRTCGDGPSANSSRNESASDRLQSPEFFDADDGRPRPAGDDRSRRESRRGTSQRRTAASAATDRHCRSRSTVQERSKLVVFY